MGQSVRFLDRLGRWLISCPLYLDSARVSGSAYEQQPMNEYVTAG
jgi:hypothetical protein